MVDRGEENCGDLVDSTATAPKNVFTMSINNDEIENSKKVLSFKLKYSKYIAKNWANEISKYEENLNSLMLRNVEEKLKGNRST